MNAHESITTCSPWDGCRLQPEQLAQLRRGDAAAFESVVREFGARMLAVARRFLRCEDDAHDAVQEAFLSAFRRIDSFEGQSKLGTWLHRITVNVCLMRLRSAKNKPSVSIEGLLPTFDETGHHSREVAQWPESPVDTLEAVELRQHVRKCIDQLPEQYRTIILLRDIEELDTAQTAERLQISEAAAKVRLHRARQALRSLIDPVFSGENVEE